MSVEFDTPANRIIAQFAPKNQFGIDTSLPDMAFLRQMSIQGRLRFFRGGSTIIPPTGETFFLYQIVANGTSDLTNGSVTLTNSGVTRISIGVGNISTIGIVLPIFDSLVGDGIRSMVTSFASATGHALGWVENTSRIRDVAP